MTRRQFGQLSGRGRVKERLSGLASRPSQASYMGRSREARAGAKPRAGRGPRPRARRSRGLRSQFPLTSAQGVRGPESSGPGPGASPLPEGKHSRGMRQPQPGRRPWAGLDTVTVL